MINKTKDSQPSWTDIFTSLTQHIAGIINFSTFQLNKIITYSRKSYVIFQSYLEFIILFMIHSKPIEEEPLFKVLDIGDRLLKNLHKYGIILVGLSRSGKSTTFNWCLKNQMIGATQGGDPFYKTVIQSTNNAIISDGFTSTTLIPNSAELDEQTSLLDMAGFGDNRNYVGVMGVSYFLKSVFDKVRMAKFVIVLSEQYFSDGTGKQLVASMNGFFKMFNIKNMTPQIKTQLFQSVSILVTRAPSVGQNEKFKVALERLRTAKMAIQNRDLMFELLDYLFYESRIHNFEAAVLNQYNGEFDMFPKMDKFGWKYFDIDNAEIMCFDKAQQVNQRQIKIRDVIINIPFQDDFQQLSTREVKKFRKEVDDKIKVYSEFNQIQNVLTASFQQNWRKCVQNNFAQQDLKQLVNFQKVFIKIQQFLERIDVYESENLVNPQVRADYSAPNFVSTLRSVKNIFNILEELMNLETDKQFAECMNQYSSIFQKLVDAINPFCHNFEDEKLILRLKYVLGRGFVEFSKFYEIDRALIHKAQRDIKDRCTMQIQKSDYFKQFTQQMTVPILNKLFNTIQDIEEYEGFFIEYKKQQISQKQMEQGAKDIQNHKKSQIQQKKSLFCINEIKTKKYIDNQMKKQACQSYINLIELIPQIVQYSEEQFNEQQKQKLISTYFMKKMHLIKDLGICLASLPSATYTQAKRCAINLFANIHSFDDICSVYDQIVLQQAKSPLKLFVTLKNYANDCLKSGEVDKARLLLKKKLSVDITNQNLLEYQSTVKELSKIQKGENSFDFEHQTELNKMQQMGASQIQLEYLTNSQDIANLLQPIKKILAP